MQRRDCHLHLSGMVADHRKGSDLAAGSRCSRDCHHWQGEGGHFPGPFIVLQAATLGDEHRRCFGGIQHGTSAGSNQSVAGMFFIHIPDLLHGFYGGIGFCLMEHRIHQPGCFQTVQDRGNDPGFEQVRTRDHQRMPHHSLRQGSCLFHGPRSRHHGFRHMPGKCLDISVSAHSMNPLIFRAARISCTLPSIPMRALLIVRS